jgi:hypothetical protein
LEILVKDLTPVTSAFVEVLSYLYEFSILASEVERIKSDFDFLFILALF